MDVKLNSSSNIKSKGAGDLQQPIPKLPKLKHPNLTAMLKFFQPCCFPAVPKSKLSVPRRSSTPKSFISSNVAYTLKTSAGRLNPYKPVDKEVLDVFFPVENEIKERILLETGIVVPEADTTGEKLKKEMASMELTVESYRTQAVVGTNYFLKLRINDGPNHLHARIYEPVEGDSFLTDISLNKTAADEIEYF